MKKSIESSRAVQAQHIGEDEMTRNVFEDLGFSPEEAAALKLKTDLHTKIVKCAAHRSQTQLQTLLDESQPRVSELLRGKMSKFSLETLVIYAAKLGLHTELKTTTPKEAWGGMEVFIDEAKDLPPDMFGGGRVDSSKAHHVFIIPHGHRNYAICSRCDLSDVYICAFNVPCKP